MPRPEDIRRLLGELPRLTARAIDNLNGLDVEKLVKPPKLSKHVILATIATTKAAAAPTTQRTWRVALHAHAEALLTSPKVAIDDRLAPSVFTFVEKCLARPEAAACAALLAAAWEVGGHSNSGYDHQCVDAPSLFTAVQAHTLTPGRSHVVPLQHQTRCHTAIVARLDDDTNRVHDVPTWDNARCSMAAAIWCAREVSALYKMRTTRHHSPIYHILPFLEGVPHRGDVERCRAEMQTWVGELKIKKNTIAALPNHRRVFENTARRVFDTMLPHRGMHTTQRFYHFSAILLREVFAS